MLQLGEGLAARFSPNNRYHPNTDTIDFTEMAWQFFSGIQSK
jgi:hypothetical protein